MACVVFSAPVQNQTRRSLQSLEEQAITTICNEDWELGSDKHSNVKHVYRDGERLGRVRSWKEENLGELTGEWYTVERWENGLYVPQEGMHGGFQEALERVATFGVAE